MANDKIEHIQARQIFDSRGNPTVEAQITLNGGISATAQVPSGASTGSKEALELRDGGSDYMGKGVTRAVDNINTTIAKALKGFSVQDQKNIDTTLIELDGTKSKSHLGANALLAVSLAAARVGSLSAQLPLYRYLREVAGCPYFTPNSLDYHLPIPMMNVINGGAHASNNLDFQEFMLVPQLQTFKESLKAGVEIFHHLKSILTKKKLSTNVGDEGGFAPDLNSHEEALNLISEACHTAGYKLGSEIYLSLDVAASEFFEDGIYHVQGNDFTSAKLLQYYQDLARKFPIYSIEDGFSEFDVAGFIEMQKCLGDTTLLVGDDLFVTNPAILKQGIREKWANAILIKVNQIGTLSETFQCLELAKNAHMKAIISHRSGETADSFIADLAVASSCRHIKTGSASRTDRMEKYNQLLRIEEQLCSQHG